jgi:hypothetical protein
LVNVDAARQVVAVERLEDAWSHVAGAGALDLDDVSVSHQTPSMVSVKLSVMVSGFAT